MRRIIRPLLPRVVLRAVRRLRGGRAQPPYAATGERTLAYARQFSAAAGGRAEAIGRLAPLIRAGDNRSCIVDADLLDAFMPDYTDRLYEYYAAQQYQLLFRFLQYPFLGDTLRIFIEAYRLAISRLGRISVVDYGCGIPYGLLDVLQTHPQAVERIALVDLDLIHVRFARFLVENTAPGLPLNVYALRDPAAVPPLSGEYNFFFGKDVFEHLHRPEEHLQALLRHSSRRCVCLFDFQHHGPMVYQHVTPDIGHLHQVMHDVGFHTSGQLHGLTEFSRDG